MSYNGSGTFQINTSGQPVVTGTSISSTAFNALTADLATGLSTAITKDGQTTTTARIPFALGINSTLVTDATNTTSGSIITAGGVGIAKALYVGTTLNVAGASTMTGSIAVDSVTDSSSTTTGSIQTDGGVGIAKALFVGTTANIVGVTTVQAGTAALPAITTTGDTNTGIFFPAADTIAFAEGGVEAMRIDSSGNLLVGTTGISTGSFKGLQIGVNAGGFGNCLTQNPAGTSTRQWNFGMNSSDQYIVYGYNNTTFNTGAYIAWGGTSWTAQSDERKKDIIEPIADAMTKVSTLRSVIGKYKTDAEGTRRSFLIAQDVQAVLPEAVDASKPDSLGVQYTEVIPLLVAAIKEQTALITTLTARITALEGA
jgi:hypothetical protein